MRNKILAALIISSIPIAFGAFWDVQNLKKEVQTWGPVTRKNKALLCLIGLQVKIDRDKLEELCIRED
ncbi:MAG: hypothetical protein KDC82_02940 [Bacteroidetes bacterium]|nr:hypothetical protein [Bacteroidota bacterium]